LRNTLSIIIPTFRKIAEKLGFLKEIALPTNLPGILYWRWKIGSCWRPCFSICYVFTERYSWHYSLTGRIGNAYSVSG
jgi:hypothetical protein